MKFNKATTIVSFVGNWGIGTSLFDFVGKETTKVLERFQRLDTTWGGGENFRSLTRAIVVSEFADSCQKRGN